MRACFSPALPRAAGHSRKASKAALPAVTSAPTIKMEIGWSASRALSPGAASRAPRGMSSPDPPRSLSQLKPTTPSWSGWRPRPRGSATSAAVGCSMARAGWRLGAPKAVSRRPVAACLHFQEKTEHVGWTAGAGIEHAFTPNWIFGLEYNYVDLGQEKYGGHQLQNGVNAGGPEYFVDLKFSTVLARLSYKFGPTAPVVAPVLRSLTRLSAIDARRAGPPPALLPCRNCPYLLLESLVLRR